MVPPGPGELFAAHGVAVAYLFGSRAEGTARESSDYDVAVMFVSAEPPFDMTERPAADPAAELGSVQWHTSGYSSGATNCVQVAFLDGLVAVRDPKNPQKAPLLCMDAECNAFIDGVLSGELRRERRLPTRPY